MICPINIFGEIFASLFYAHIFLTKSGLMLYCTTPYTEPVTFPVVASETLHFSPADYAVQPEP